MSGINERLNEKLLEEIEANKIEDNVTTLDHILLILSGFGVFGIGTIWYFYFYL